MVSRRMWYVPLPLVIALAQFADPSIHLSFSQLLARSLAIRNSWKARHGQPPGPPPKAHPLPPKPVSMPPAPPSSHQGPFAAAARPPPPQHQHQHQQPPAPRVEQRYSRLAPSPWSKVTGPAMMGGMYR